MIIGEPMEYLATEARVRLHALLDRAEPRYASFGGMTSNRGLFNGSPPSFYEALEPAMREHAGYRLLDHSPPLHNTRDVCIEASEQILEWYLAAAVLHLYKLGEQSGGEATPVSWKQLERGINDVLQAARYPRRLKQLEWIETTVTLAEALRRAFLGGDDDDMAPCQQGDVQVEMVVSTVQERLARPDIVILDYGAGLGRVLHGMSTAVLFEGATYIAVEEPINKSIQELAAQPNARVITRSDFCNNPVAADVILLVNTLHHIPFVDIADQVGLLLECLQPDGLLVVHEMGEHPTPEKRNVPCVSNTFSSCSTSLG